MYLSVTCGTDELYTWKHMEKGGTDPTFVYPQCCTVLGPVVPVPAARKYVVVFTQTESQCELALVCYCPTPSQTYRWGYKF